jgi:hypothetical protein
MSLGINLYPLNSSLINGVGAGAQARTVTPQMSGTTFICTKAAALTTVTLPDPSIAGLKYKFIMAQAAVTAPLITLQSPVAATMAGIWVGATPNVNPTANPCATVNANFTATAQWGDSWELVSDGVLWRAYGVSGVAAGCSFS